MTCEDWRNLSPAEIAPLLNAERARWLCELRWETQATWATVEAARAAGRLPGLVVRDGGRITGWAFYLLHGDMMQVGALAADEARGVRRLLDELLQVPEAARADRVSLFVLPSGASLAPALTRRRFAMRAHEYLALDLTSAAARAWQATKASAPAALRPLREADETDLVRLLAEAYRGLSSAECFAPHGRLDEWAWYVRQLLRTPACGTLVPDATFVVDAPERGGLAGVVMTTDVSASTAHIAQIVVSPHAQRAGLGRALLAAAIDLVRERGAARMTLMVAEDNGPAKALYARAGFEAGPVFVYAERPLPRRLARAS
jgi:ribosomal protein S18 acetylase RimI-like enzyme